MRGGTYRLAIFSHFVEKDGGFRYAKMQFEYLMPGGEYHVLSDVGGLLGLATRVYLSKVFVKIRRTGLFNVIDRCLGFLLVTMHVRVFKMRHPTPFMGVVYCMSESPITLEFLDMLKRDGLISEVQYSMLDLPWSFRSASRYREFVRRRTRLIFGKVVTSADFVTPEMQLKFGNDVFNGPSFNSFSAIEMVVNSPDQGSNAFISEGRHGMCYAGAFRANKEFFEFLQMFQTQGIQSNSTFDVYGPYDPRVKINTANVRYVGNYDIPVLRQTLRRYQYGFVPMSFDRSDAELVETSFPGKAWLYVACGVTPVVYAPADAAISKFFKRESVGVVLTNRSELLHFMKSYFGDTEQALTKTPDLVSLKNKIVGSHEAFKSTIIGQDVGKR